VVDTNDDAKKTSGDRATIKDNRSSSAEGGGKLASMGKMEKNPTGNKKGVHQGGSFELRRKSWSARSGSGGVKGNVGDNLSLKEGRKINCNPERTEKN